MIVIFNKILLTSYEFPSIAFLMLCQSVVSSLFFYLKTPEKPDRNVIIAATTNTFNIYLGLNAATGLNVAMFTALRRISILLTMVLQWYLLKNKPTQLQIVSICMMVFGSFVAAANDISFNVHGYLFVMANNIFTAVSQITTKKALKNKSKETLLFYSAIMCVCISAFGCMHFKPQDWHMWDNTGVRIVFVGSICMGLVINWAAAWVIEMNDALTLAVAGSTKSAMMGLVVCAGLFDPTYIFDIFNFAGLQISTLSSFLYVYSKKKTQSPPTQPKSLV